MGDIKSAREIAMARVAKMGEATDEERRQWRYTPEGEKLAARYLREDVNLTVELSRYEAAVRPYIAAGAADILVRNIGLPKSDAARQNNRKAMDGLKMVKKDRVKVENVYSQLRRLFSHYTETGEQQRQQAYQQLKADFQARLRQAVQQQMGPLAQMAIDVEKQPQFQDEWLKLQSRLEAPYRQHLDEYRHELMAID
ncbi:MAG: hypothetical protein V1780_01625 [Chloroflexota bacterium]